MPESLISLKRKTLEQHLQDLYQEYEAANRQLGRMLGDVDRLRLQRQIKDLEQEIREVEGQIRSLASSQTTSSSQTGSVSTDHALPASVFENPRHLAGESIGAYQLIEFLGAGGSGLVFRSQHETLGRQAAVKLFYPIAPSVGDFHTLFEKGFRALGALDHPNIVKIFDFGPVGVAATKTFYLAMEYIQGKPLDLWSQALADDKNALMKRLDAAIVVAEALTAAHETTYYDEIGFETRGVLHGDLKPANILVSDSGKVKLTDFLLVDIQRLLDPRVMPPQFRRRKRPTTEAFGTPGFMAPEQEKQGIVTVQTDIFGLGMTSIHLFFPVVDPVPALFMSGEDEFLPELKDLVLQMIANPPQKRPSDMREVVERLRSIRRKYQPGLAGFHKLVQVFGSNKRR